MSRQERPDVARVLDGLKDFQRRTVDHVFERMYAPEDPSLRFLVADEVGLGKTLVARGVVARAIDHLWDKVGRIDIVYICSNADIARQNLDRLNVAGQDDAVLASRLTRISDQIGRIRGRKLHFISFTPGTSFSTNRSQGQAKERVILYWLLKSLWRLGDGVAPMNVLQGASGTESFRSQVRRYNPRWIDSTIRRSFREWVRAHDAEARERGEPTLRARFRELEKALPRARESWRLPDDIRLMRTELVSDLRAVLAAACVTALEPDLVILDEFQRFRHLLDPHDDASKLAHELFNYGKTHEKGKYHERCRTLLLSATPYKMYTIAGEAGEEDHYRDFLDTTEFLFDRREPRERLEELLRDLRREMLRLETADQERVRALRGEIESLLRRVMVRTERLAAASDRNGMLSTAETDLPRLERADVEGYIDLQAVVRELDQRGDALEYWKSAPFVLNLMDQYKLKRDFVQAVKDGSRRTLTRADTGALLRWEDIEHYRRLNHGNPRIRWLEEQLIETGAWKLAWLPPSLPYYELAGPFASEETSTLTKRLVFSAWHVVPKAIASLLSYAAEREMMRSRGGRPLNTQEARDKRRRLLEFSRTRGRLAGMPVLGLLYPSPTLARELDPLVLAHEYMATEGRIPRRHELLSWARERCAELLKALPARSSDGSEDEAWYWAAPLLLDLSHSTEQTHAWFAQASLADTWARGDSDRDARAASGFADHVERARQLLAGEFELGRMPANLATVLAEVALAGPATCLLRALGRIANSEDEIAGVQTRNAAASASFAFRRLFNAPEITALVRGRRDSAPYWRRVLQYSLDGGLQPVLDEYAHVLVESLGLIDKPSEQRVSSVAEEIGRSVGIRPARVRLDEIDPSASGDDAINRREMRARFAMRFGVRDESDEGSTYADTVRAAFNSPFWPFVLASTSVGQEGLDFHLYCHAIVHWNLPSNPVDLEQREGRVHRYKNHAVRKNLALTYGEEVLRNGAHDPWEALFRLACDDRDEGETELVPYWVYPVEGGATIERHVPHLPLSSDAARLEQLVRSLAVYRMVFGQPRQDDLVKLLLTQLAEDGNGDREELLADLRVDLSPAR